MWEKKGNEEISEKMKCLVCQREGKLVFFGPGEGKQKQKRRKIFGEGKLLFCRRRRRKRTNLFEKENVTDAGRHMMKKGGKRYSASRWKIIA